MDKKITHVYPGKPMKRRFWGNQYINITISINLRLILQVHQRSSEKLQKIEDDEIRKKRAWLCILNFFFLFCRPSAMTAKCVKINICFNATSNRELGFKLVVKRSYGVQYINSCSFIDKAYKINCWIVFVMRLLKVGKEGINLFLYLWYYRYLSRTLEQHILFLHAKYTLCSPGRL